MASTNYQSGCNDVQVLPWVSTQVESVSTELHLPALQELRTRKEYHIERDDEFIGTPALRSVDLYNGGYEKESEINFGAGHTRSEQIRKAPGTTSVNCEDEVIENIRLDPHKDFFKPPEIEFAVMRPYANLRDLEMEAMEKVWKADDGEIAKAFMVPARKEYINITLHG